MGATNAEYSDREQQGCKENKPQKVIKKIGLIATSQCMKLVLKLRVLTATAWSPLVFNLDMESVRRLLSEDFRQQTGSEGVLSSETS